MAYGLGTCPPSSVQGHSIIVVIVVVGHGYGCHGCCRWCRCHRCQHATGHENNDHLPRSWPSGPCTCKTANHNELHGFHVGVNWAHQTWTRATRTPDTAGWAKPVLNPNNRYHAASVVEFSKCFASRLPVDSN